MQNIKNNLITELLKSFVVCLAELETHKTAAWSQHSIRLAHYFLDIRTVANAKRDRIQIVRVVRLFAQLFGIADTPLDVGRKADSFGTIFSHVEHVGVYVSHGDFHVRYRRVFVLQIAQIFKCNVTFKLIG